ncbi:Zinc finger FYVE/FYVE-related type [Carpediemonas membranifera]|uniref:Zinc finger FYVE/FYVE-related type n=1 Tax=Carpediemonas membranifera TaxID=201153 RepID=A0A8J6AW72_9EUKA|nr:Zinc finger FYVE/FYVE-related type [Carpediemonas membranifera]|eukprot:KAG9389763.1 Zinc finger FYVE/FYVE-related type [Carpediemonas membranifera]
MTETELETKRAAVNENMADDHAVKAVSKRSRPMTKWNTTALSTCRSILMMGMLKAFFTFAFDVFDSDPTGLSIKKLGNAFNHIIVSFLQPCSETPDFLDELKLKPGVSMGRVVAKNVRDWAETMGVTVAISDGKPKVVHALCKSSLAQSVRS